MPFFKTGVILSILIATFSLSVTVDEGNGAIRENFRSSDNDEFTCNDGSKSFSMQHVNDDYCDCDDGSDEPETSACNNGHFKCKNEGHISSVIVSSHVNDGICDCCDGSDEYNGFVSCPNTCKNEHSDWLINNNARFEKYSKGSSILHEWISQSEALLSDKETKKTLLTEEINILEESITDIKNVISVMEEQPTVTSDSTESSESSEYNISDKPAAIELYGKLGLDKLSDNELRYLLLSTLARTTYSGPMPLQHLQIDIMKLDETININEDISIEDIKKVLEGGEATIDDERLKKKKKLHDLEKKCSEKKIELLTLDDSTFYGKKMELYMMKGNCYRKTINKYEYSICPYGTSKQDITSLGGNFSVVDENNRVITENSILHIDENGKMITGDIFFKWENGQSCWNGPNRSLKLKLVCHDSVELLLLTEPSMCVYEGELGTPAVCPL